jgi:predicted permease
VRDEVDAELRLHVELRARRLREAGVGEDEALRRARAAFGDPEGVRRTCVRIQRRRRSRTRRREWVDGFLQDVRHAVRASRRRPSFTGVALATLALGMGVTAAVFAVVEAVLLHPLPFGDEPPAHFVVDPRWNEPAPAPPLLVDTWKRQASGVAEVVALAPVRRALTGAGAPRRVQGWRVEPGLFRLLSTPLARGRGFTAADGADGVVLGPGLWRAAFGGDPEVVGRIVELDGRRVRVLGVLPPSWDFGPETPQFLEPLALTPEEWANPGGWYLTTLVRPAPGVAARTVLAELNRLAAATGIEVEDGVPARAGIRPVRDVVTGPVRAPLLLLLGSVGLVLLIGCANVANLLLAGNRRRRRELAVRAALGAGRGRVVRQLLSEALVLGLAGALLALPVASVTLDFLLALAPAELPRVAEARLGATTLGFTLGLGIVTSLLFGVVPALRAGGRGLHSGLKEGSRGAVGRTRSLLRPGLIGAEVAISLALLVASGLLLRSAGSLARVERGFDEAVLTARVGLPGDRYPEVSDAIEGFERLQGRLAGLGDVVDVAYASRVPLAGNGFGLPVVRAGEEDAGPPAANPRMRIASVGYFRTAGIAVLAGRAFTPDDDVAGARAVVIDEVLARELGFAPEQAPGEDVVALGDDFRDDTGAPRVWQVVGVVAATRSAGLRERPHAQLYIPPRAVPPAPWNWIGRELVLAVRTAGAPERVVPDLRAAVAQVDPLLPLADVQTLRERIAASLALERMVRVLLTALGGLALLLSTGGVAGVVAHLVARRRPEMGLRLALGASSAGVTALMVRQAMVPVAAGAVAGIGLAALAAGRLAPLLHGVTPGDPWTYAGATGLLMGAALVAAWIPGRRAGRVDPVKTLTAD